MFSITHFLKSAAIAIAAYLLPGMAHSQDTKANFHGAAWLQMGKITRSYTTPSREGNSYVGNWMQNAGALLSTDMKMSDSWGGSAGFGVIQVHLARGNRNHANIWYPFWVPFVSEARLTYTAAFSESDHLKISMGNFGYSYNPDVKNLGLYLLKGYVYPGALVSGFGNLTGAMASFEADHWKNDFIVNIESEDQPFYDISVADAATFKVGHGLEFGAGFNLYRLIAQNGDLNSPGKDCKLESDLGFYATKCFEVDSIGVDGAGKAILDTVTGNLGGTKVMARFHLDPKEMFGFSGPFGKGDLLLYGEAAVIGLKNQGKAYNDIKRRIPVMIGINLPTFGYLDFLAFEMEYYASKNSSDNLEAQYGTWVPVTDKESNWKRDDWKWSLGLSKVIMDHMKLTAQVANDHLRPGGYHDSQTGVEATTIPTDRYYTVKCAYFF
jgi:hypothetical protein